MAKKLTPRETIEKALTAVAKTNKIEVVRAVPHGASKSGIGALQARREGKVIVSVRDRDVVIYVSPKELKAGRPGPKGWENVAHFNHNTPIKTLEKAFKDAFKSKNKVTGSKPMATKDITAQRKALEAKLERLKKEEKASKVKPKTKTKKKNTDSKPKAKAKPKKVDKTAEAAVASVAATN